MKVRVTIRGRTYTVRSDEDDVDVTDVARFVDARMGDIARSAPSLDEATVALLAALNIASDLRRLQLGAARDLDELAREVASATVMLEAALPRGTDDDTTEDEEGA